MADERDQSNARNQLQSVLEELKQRTERLNDGLVLLLVVLLVIAVASLLLTIVKIVAEGLAFLLVVGALLYVVYKLK
jgi:hypothetical protein